MKHHITTFLLVFISILTYGQDKNEILYRSIVKNDLMNVKQALSQNADPNYIKSSGEWTKVNMLITAINHQNLDITRLLIEKKADVNWKDGFNTTALMYAASKGNKEIVVLLLDSGADINANDGKGNSVLSAARESKNKVLVKFIESRLTMNPKKDNGKLKDLIKKADNLCSKAENYIKANELYTSALNYNENLAEIYTKRAGTFYAMRDFENAIKDFTKVIELQPEDMSTIYFMRGLSKTLLQKEDKEGGCSDIKRAIELGYDISNIIGLDEYCNFKKS